MPSLPASSIAHVTPADAADLSANRRGLLSDGQRARATAWRKAVGQEIVGRSILLVVGVGTAHYGLKHDWRSSVTAVGPLDMGTMILLGVTLWFGLPWLGAVIVWALSAADLRRGRVSASMGRLSWSSTGEGRLWRAIMRPVHWRAGGFRARSSWRSRRTVGYAGAPLPVDTPDPRPPSIPAATLLGGDVTLYSLPWSGVVVLAQTQAARDALAAADLELTQIMRRAFGMTEADLATNRQGYLSRRQRFHLSIRALAFFLGGAFMLAVLALGLALVIRQGQFRIVAVAMILFMSVLPVFLFVKGMEGLRSLAGRPEVGRTDDFVMPEVVGYGRRSVTCFTAGLHRLPVPSAAYHAMPSGTLCRLYVAPNGDLLGVDPLIDPEGEELALLPLKTRKKRPRADRRIGTNNDPGAEAELATPGSDVNEAP